MSIKQGTVHNGLHLKSMWGGMEHSLSKEILASRLLLLQLLFLLWPHPVSAQAIDQ